MEGLYLIHTREFITTDMPIYKIGRADNINKAMVQCPNGSQFLFISICKNSKLCEGKILEVFKQKFLQEKYYGNKYFSGDFYEMIDVMNEYITIYNQQNREEDLDLDLELQN
jgi:hypothetical protein